MTTFLNSLSSDVMQKAKLSESNLYGRYSSWIMRYYQYKFWSFESHRINPFMGTVYNDEDDLQALDINLMSGETRGERIIDNH